MNYTHGGRVKHLPLAFHRRFFINWVAKEKTIMRVFKNIPTLLCGTALLLATDADANQPLIWDNARNNNLWDLATLNWHVAGAANGTSAFKMGDSVVFNATANQAPALQIDADVDNMDVSLNAAGRTWTLSGAKDLAVHGTLRVDSLGHATLDAPRVTGPGSLVLSAAAPVATSKATFSLTDHSTYTSSLLCFAMVSIISDEGVPG